MEFVPWPKTPRLKEAWCTITEKIDGTNAQVFVPEDGDRILAGSRTRYVDPENDNYGFAVWCRENEDKLWSLGPGRHYGEWWGPGIQRRYSVPTKRLSLFNVNRYRDGRDAPPDGIFAVPLLYSGPFELSAVNAAMKRLESEGSVASPGFMYPEGVVIHIPATGHRFKELFDPLPKSYKMGKAPDVSTVGV